MNCFKKIYKIVSLIPKGKVMTYKQVAEITKTNPRVVGFALHANKSPNLVPCHRIVRKDGSLASGYAFGGLKKQKELLKKEGVEFVNNEKVNPALFF